MATLATSTNSKHVLSPSKQTATLKKVQYKTPTRHYNQHQQTNTNTNNTFTALLVQCYSHHRLHHQQPNIKPQTDVASKTTTTTSTKANNANNKTRTTRAARRYSPAVKSLGTPRVLSNILARSRAAFIIAALVVACVSTLSRRVVVVDVNAEREELQVAAAIAVAPPIAGSNFEAAFQGQCYSNKSSNPCQHICLDLHDGTYECGCHARHALAVDGYSCAPIVDSASSAPNLNLNSNPNPNPDISPNSQSQKNQNQTSREKANISVVDVSEEADLWLATNRAAGSGSKGKASSRFGEPASLGPEYDINPTLDFLLSSQKQLQAQQKQESQTAYADSDFADIVSDDEADTLIAAKKEAASSPAPKRPHHKHLHKNHRKKQITDVSETPTSVLRVEGSKVGPFIGSNLDKQDDFGADKRVGGDTTDFRDSEDVDSDIEALMKANDRLVGLLRLYAINNANNS